MDSTVCSVHTVCKHWPLRIFCAVPLIKKKKKKHRLVGMYADVHLISLHEQVLLYNSQINTKLI